MDVTAVDDLLLSSKRLPASPRWLPHGSRDGEMKARLPVEVDGELGLAEIELTIKTADPDYVVIVFLTPVCVARLCIGTGHRNRITGEVIADPHFHRWSKNRHLTARNRENLPFAEVLPQSVNSRDAAFSWFLEQVDIDFPSWFPVIWPDQGDLF